MYEDDIEFFNIIINKVLKNNTNKIIEIMECETCILYLNYLEKYYKDTVIKIFDKDVFEEYKKIIDMKNYIKNIVSKYDDNQL